MSKFIWNPEPLKYLINVSEMSIHEIADACGISSAAITQYKTGKTKPGIDAIYALAEFFAVPSDYLLGLSKTPEAIEKNYPAVWQQIKKASYEEYLRRSSQKSGRVFSIPEGYISPWPYNLVEQVVSGFTSSKVPAYENVLTQDNLEGLSYSLSTLADREEKMILAYYREQKTLEEIGKEYGINRERVRQIIAKGIRKLRHPSKRYPITEGFEGYKLLQTQAALDRKEQDLEERILKLEELEAKLEGREQEFAETYGVSVQTINETPIADLELSVRSFNCLNRKGFKTVNDIIAFNMNYPMNEIRNLGFKSFLEIQRIVQDMTGTVLEFKKTLKK